MSSEPGQTPEAPRLPPALLQVWPFIGLGFLGWLIAAAAAFVVPALEGWRPIAVAGLGVGLLGTGIFVLQLRAARRGPAAHSPDWKPSSTTSRTIQEERW